MEDRPIIFSAAMVRALLDGRKTQTRRLATSPLRKCVAGDRLWVRESIRIFADIGDDCEIVFLANGRGWQTGPCTGEIPDAALAPYFKMIDQARAKPTRALSRPSIHMPRWASRLTLTVEAVRVEPLQAISEVDAIAEGIVWQEPTDADRQWARELAEEEGGDGTVRGVWIAEGTDCGFGPKPRCPIWGPTAANCYRGLWSSLHTAEGQRWDENPAVVAITFRVERGNIDRLPTTEGA
jgi:hypothetical protein